MPTHKLPNRAPRRDEPKGASIVTVLYFSTGNHRSNSVVFDRRRHGANPRTLTAFQAPSERIAFAYGEDQYLTGSNNNLLSQFWFDGQKASCPAPSQTPTEWWDDQSNQLARAAIAYHANGIISTFVDGHAKKIQYGSITTAQATFATENQCQSTNFYGPDGQYGTVDDPDTALTRAMGRFWDDTY